MKIYSVQVLDENHNQIGTSILTASSEVAKAFRQTWKDNLRDSKMNNRFVTIYTYEIKTQGKNFNDFALAEYFNE